MGYYSGRTRARRTDRGGSMSDRANVGDLERFFSAAYGAVLAAYGLTRGSLCGLAMTAAGGMLLHRGATGYCPVYKAIDVDSSAPERESFVKIVENITINRPREEVYASWRDFEQMPRFMYHIESINKIDDRLSQWRARLPKGIGILEWESEITEDRPDELVSWRSLPDADIQNRGEAIFRNAPGKRGTEMEVDIEYRPPAGKLGQIAAGLLNPAFSKIIRQDIRRFKALLETGEVPTTEGQPTG